VESVEVMPNLEMEPTLLTVSAIVSLRRAAHFERWADSCDPMP
jgi:hypothetical protein